MDLTANDNLHSVIAWFHSWLWNVKILLFICYIWVNLSQVTDRTKCQSGDKNVSNVVSTYLCHYHDNRQWLIRTWWWSVADGDRGGGYWLSCLLCCDGGYTVTPVSTMCPVRCWAGPGYNTVCKYVAEMLHQQPHTERDRQVVVSRSGRRVVPGHPSPPWAGWRWPGPPSAAVLSLNLLPPARLQSRLGCGLET